MKDLLGEFPGGLVVRILGSHCVVWVQPPVGELPAQRGQKKNLLEA